jgi:hypothetical protein
MVNTWPEMASGIYGKNATQTEPTECAARRSCSGPPSGYSFEKLKFSEIAVRIILQLILFEQFKTLFKVVAAYF